MASGNSTCPCLNVSNILSSAIAVTRNGHYASPVYGSECRIWPALELPDPCDGTFCDAWCYVNQSKCMASPIFFEATRTFPILVDKLFFSHGTCSGQEEAMYNAAQEAVGTTLRIAVPQSSYPHFFKRDADGQVYYGRGALYYDESIPWEGAMVEFVNALLAIAPWKNVSFQTLSGGAMTLWPGSPWTASVQDVGSGVADMSIAPLDVTAERLKLSAFSGTLYQDELYLWVPRPVSGSAESFSQTAVQIFEPFGSELWLTLLAVVFGMVIGGGLG